MKRTNLIISLGIAVSVAASAPLAVQAEEAKLPRTMVWTAYDLGSSGYAEASAIANGLMKNHDTRVRIVPSGTSIGRLLPITMGKADYGFLASEAYFAAEGTYDFAAPSWGPQDIRIVLGKPTAQGLATGADAKIKLPKDMKGKRIGYVKGNPSINVKNDAYLAFGGLTRDDVEVVWFGGYGPMKDALINDQIDGFIAPTTSGNVREIEASPRGLAWMEFPPEDEEGWKAMRSVASFYEPRRESRGAALSEESPKHLLGFRYPVMTAYARTTADEVYELVKAIDESYEDFKETTATSSDWHVEKSGRPPADAPWHEGTIRFMKEKGLWRPQDQAWHEARLARLETLIEAWGDATEAFTRHRVAEAEKGNKVDPEAAWEPFWDEYRRTHVEGAG